MTIPNTSPQPRSNTMTVDRALHLLAYLTIIIVGIVWILYRTGTVT